MIALIRGLSLFVPFGVALGLWQWRQPTPSERTAVLVALCWNAAALLGVAAINPGWWHWGAQVEGALVFGMPVDIWMGWTLLWGITPLLSQPVWVVALGAAFLDLQVMRMMEPVLVLSPDWLVGEGVAVGLALIPGLWLAELTRERRKTGWRAAGQVVWFWGCVALLLPLWMGVRVPALTWQFLVLPVGWFASAALSFVEDGDGTPIPFDAPHRLVSTGLYGYVRNPMQVTAAIGFIVLGAGTGSLAIAAGALVVWVYSVGFATWHEAQQLGHRLEGWSDYCAQVPAWWARWRPVPGPVATLYYGDGCGICSDLAQRIAGMEPVGLVLRPASEHPASLTRVRWERPGCAPADGLQAVCRALEQVNLAWALVAVFGRLPGVRSVLQIAVDALGGAPRQRSTT